MLILKNFFVKNWLLFHARNPSHSLLSMNWVTDTVSYRDSYHHNVFFRSSCPDLMPWPLSRHSLLQDPFRSQWCLVYTWQRLRSPPGTWLYMLRTKLWWKLWVLIVEGCWSWGSYLIAWSCSDGTSSHEFHTLANDQEDLEIGPSRPRWCL